MANGTEIRALELGEQIAQKQNVYIVDVTYKKADDTYSLCYYIDKEGGIGIDECELFSYKYERVGKPTLSEYSIFLFKRYYIT